MRPLAIAGLPLLITGGFFPLRGLGFTSQNSMRKVGDSHASLLLVPGSPRRG
jgi:hypothetical protein